MGRPAQAEAEHGQVRRRRQVAEELRDVAISRQKLRQAKEAADPLAEAEAALKKLKEHPDDKQAADALEKALQRLKERRAKPEGTAEKPQQQ